MHRIGTGTDSHLDELVHHQVGLRRGGTAQSVRLIGQLHVQGVAVGISVDGNGLQSFVAGRANHTDGDFAAVGDEDFTDRAGVSAGDRGKFFGGFCLVLSHLKLSFISCRKHIEKRQEWRMYRLSYCSMISNSVQICVLEAQDTVLPTHPRG